MKDNTKRKPALIFIIIGAMILLAFLALTVVDFANRSLTQIPVLGEVPPFSFTSHHNQQFNNTNLDGKLSVISFMFTRCKSICPVMSANVLEVYDFYAHSDKLQFVSITVDPDVDSIPQLAKYADSLGVNDMRWIFLRTEIENVIDFSENGLMIGAGNLPGGHSTRLVLVDHLGQIRSYHNGMDKEELELMKNNINILAREL